MGPMANVCLIRISMTGLEMGMWPSLVQDGPVFALGVTFGKKPAFSCVAKAGDMRLLLPMTISVTNWERPDMR